MYYPCNNFLNPCNKMSNQLKRLQFLFNALLTGQVIFLIIVVFIKSKKLVPDADEQLNKILQILALLIAVGGFFGGNKLFYNSIEKLRQEGISVAEKFKQYQKISIIKWAMAEAACIFALIGYLITGNAAFIALAGVLLFIFFGYNPVKSKIVQQLQLDEEEAAQL